MKNSVSGKKNETLARLGSLEGSLDGPGRPVKGKLFYAVKKGV